MANKQNRFSKIANKDAERVSEENVKISFEYLEWGTEEFFFHGMEEKYYKKFFETITTIKSSKEKQITQQIHPSLSPKSIFNTDTSIRDSFPFTKLRDKLKIQLRDDDSAESQAKEIISRAFEISLSKNYGRIHGFIWNNTFHIVWFDPAHNLYPTKSGISKHRDAATVKCFSPEENLRLQKKLKELQKDYDELYEAFAEK